MLLQRWKRGVDEYHTVFFTKQDSGISRLKDLKGKMIAFKTPFSSSGYFLPKLVLVQAELRVVPKSEAAAPVDPEEVGYVFSGADENTVMWVLKEKVSAGVIDHHRFPTEAKGSLPSLQVIYQTFAMPRHLVSYRVDLACS
jgi:phosphonate transport system substrate-binding protein